MEQEKNYSPMIRHYISLKEQYPDCLLFYRVGDFYEMFLDDAVTASGLLDLVLTGKDAGLSERIPMCGVPHHAVDSYLQRLVAKGYKVAVCEQLQDPKEAKGLVERDVVKVVTPGTFISETLDGKTSVCIGAVSDYAYGYALCGAEMSTGETFLENCEHDDRSLLACLLKNDIREVVVPPSLPAKTAAFLTRAGLMVSKAKETAVPEAYAPLAEDIKKDYEKAAFGLLLNYLETTQKRALPHLQKPQVARQSAYLIMDQATMASLELTATQSPDKAGMTLWSLLDKCVTAMGSRALKKWIEKPLTDRAAIEERLERVAYLTQNFTVRRKLGEALAGVYDLERLLTRCAMNSANALDCLRLAKTLRAAPAVKAAVDSPQFAVYQKLPVPDNLAEMICSAFGDDLSLLNNDSGIFKEGYDASLDEARRIMTDAKAFIAALESRERAKTGIKNLKIGYNRVFGYYIEISKAAARDVRDEWGYTRKQTLTGCERFVSEELKEKEEMILHAEENALAIEKRLFLDILDEIKKYLTPLQKLAHGLAEVDCQYGLAMCAAAYGYVKPSFTDDELEIAAGRHPLLDRIMREPRYIANSLRLDQDNPILLITGPNMGGKSTYMRQNALIVIMAQIGSFVPAKSCRMPVFDRIFTRIGASDDILAGRSTFMSEMSEANNALRLSTPKSLILFDEIGRGTSTYDGMALARAIIEYIASCVNAKTLFSTHYHELTSLADTIKGVRNVHVSVSETAAGVIFLYRIKDGPADRSYGINVARLAGLPDSVIERAMGLQKELESKKRVVQQSYELVAMEKEDPSAARIIADLKAVNPDELSPRQAWTMLADLCEELKEEEKK